MSKIEEERNSGVNQTLLSHAKEDATSKNFKKYPDMDSILGFGRFQHFQIWVFGALTATLGAISFCHIYFIISDPPEDWHCGSDSIEKCPAEGEVCEGGGVVYNTSHQNFINSLVTEHDWLCQKALWGPSVITATSVGMLANSLVFGHLCDKYGRVNIMHVTNIIYIVFRLISFNVAFSYPAFLVLTAIATSYFPVGCRAGYTLVAEYCDQSGRKYAFISGWVWWVFGMFIIPFIAEAMNDWYTFGIVTTLLNLIIVLLYPLVPESPRLLCSQKKFKRAAKIVATIRRVNKLEPLENLEELLEKVHDSEGDSDQLGVMSLVKEKSLRKLVLCVGVMYSVNDYFYFAGQLNAGNLAGNVFVNFAMLALTELPSVFIGQFIIDRFGRRWSHVACMTLTTVCFALNIVLVKVEGFETTVLGLSLTAKTLSNVAWFCMWVQSIETFPTLVRNSGINFSVCGSTIVSMTTPFVISLDTIDKRLPYVVFVCLGVTGMIATSLVPETKGMQLPESIEEVDTMFREMRFFELRPWNRIGKDKKKENGLELESRG